MQEQIVVECWGDFACFTRPESKVERLSYPVPTPSAMRGLLSAIYSKPKEFYWQVNRIEVLREIKYLSFKRNEVKGTVSKVPLDMDENRTQRQTCFLKNVRYRVYATMVKQPSFKGTDQSLYDQAIRRIRSGKCFFQPSLGLRECAAYFAESDGVMQPISESMDIGLMVYDVFNLHKYEVTKKTEPYVTLFHAEMKNGVIEVPDFDSDQVLKPKEV